MNVKPSLPEAPGLSVHRWNLSPLEAMAVQKQLAARVIREPRLGPVATVAGVDVSYYAGLAHAAVALLSYPGLTLLDYAIAIQPVKFPYLPGLLAFREGPVALEALARLSTKPDLLIFDGHGLAHPRRLGLASHLGVLVDMPAIGCAKQRLCGQYNPPGPERGEFTLLTDQTEIIGAVVRTQTGVKPVFVSIGHRVDLPTAIHYVLTCSRGYRLPEPIRLAHRLAGNKGLS